MVALRGWGMGAGVEPDAGAAADVEGADALGAVELVARDGGEVQLPLLDVHLDLAGSLRYIRVEEDLGLPADGADLLHGLDHANFVVHSHDRAQDGVGADRCLELGQVDQTVGFHGKVCYVEALLLQHSATVQNAFVLGLSGDQMLLLRFVKVSNSFYSHIITLCSSACEDYLLCICPDQLRYVRPSLFNCSLGFPSIVMRP